MKFIYEDIVGFFFKSYGSFKALNLINITTCKMILRYQKNEKIIVLFYCYNRSLYLLNYSSVYMPSTTVFNIAFSGT